MKQALDGLTVVVTRPAAQSARFTSLAQAAGANCIAYPTLQVEHLSLPPETKSRLRERRWDWALFTSANAVAGAFATLSPPLADKHGAVGRATARALEAAGVSVAARPESATSEGILELPEFAELAGCGVLLVKGSGGRAVLATALRAGGAEVLELEVYRRLAVAPDAAAAKALHEALTGGDGRRVVITVTSAEILRSLLDHVAPADAPHVRGKPLLVPGPRVAAEATRLGWTGPIMEASTAEDEAMVSALSRLAPSLSSAVSNGPPAGDAPAA